MCAMYKLFVILSVVASSFARTLPNELSPCSAKDPEINNCIKNEANKFIPTMVHGNAKFHIPAFDPFIVENLDAKIGNLDLNMKNIQIYGIEKSIVDAVEVDFNNNKMSMNVSIPEILLESTYTMHGKILVLPVDGTGPMQIKMKDSTFQASSTLENFQFSSKKTIKLIDTNIDYQYKDIFFHFDNLFNGNKELGDPVNKLLNEQQSVINRDFHPIFIELINAVVKSVINQIVDGYHFSDIFKE